MATVTMLLVEMLGGYATRLLRQLQTRLAVTRLFAPYAGLGLVLLTMVERRRKTVETQFDRRVELPNFVDCLKGLLS